MANFFRNSLLLQSHLTLVNSNTYLILTIQFIIQLNRIDGYNNSRHQ